MRVLGMPIECSASIGVALFGGGELTAAELLRRADRAMYVAKEAGRNTYRMFTA
jgi:diguanylate cyclase (GGDEF)-like protein